jgi:hypothetical protein
MGTQKTGIGGGDVPSAPRENVVQAEPQGEDLGIPEDGGTYIDDPSGFVANAPVKDLHGRRVRPLSDQELERAHRMQAGNVPMFGDPSLGDQPQTIEDRNGQRMQNPQQAPNRDAMRKAEQMMPDFMRTPQQQEPTTSRTQQPKQPPTGYEAASAAVQSAAFDETANMLQHLIDQEIAARNRGDYHTAAQARNMAERLTENYKLTRTSQKRDEHAAMQRLRSALGLEQIKPTEIEWAGFTWQFEPTNHRLDIWVTESLRQDGMNLAALMISAAIVGIDNVPIYDFLGIALEEEYTMTAKDPKQSFGNKVIRSKLYTKYCNCGVEVGVKDTSCPACKRSHSPFDMPIELRERCAMMFYEFLENDFGPYEELAILLDMKAAKMKDRRLDKAELYPLAVPSQEVKTTTDSQSGGA